MRLLHVILVAVLVIAVAEVGLILCFVVVKRMDRVRPSTPPTSPPGPPRSEPTSAMTTPRTSPPSRTNGTAR